MYVLQTDKLCYCILDGALVLAKVILKTGLNLSLKLQDLLK